MGLDTSHGCFHGAYSAFNRLRQHVAKACGGSFPPHDPDYTDPDDNGNAVDPTHWYYEADVVPAEHIDGMSAFLGHSDCDGEISADDARKVAAFLRWAAPMCPADGTGHLIAGVRAKVEQFAAGCERAADLGEPVVFR